MSIRKTNDIANETNSRYNTAKNRRANIEERFDDSTDNDNPYDDAIQYTAKKIDDVIDAVNTNTGKTTFPGFGTSSTTALRGNTTTISDEQADAITTNSAKTGITTSQANAITANTAKRDARYIYFPIVANFSGNINTEQFVPLSDGETEGTNQLQRRNNFIAPAAGTLHKIFVRSNASLQSGGRGVTLTAKLHKYASGDDSRAGTASTTKTTGATAVINEIDFSSVSGNNFTAGTRLLLGLQAPLNATKNYYVTVVFKLDQNDLD
tara:strand:- start:1496 stop:2293 length:798 start_codon:yes stop_codon:yes gene_type:complete